jgi:uncharacterized protein (DUF58 family)
MSLWSRASWTLGWVVRTWPRGKDGRDPVTWIWKAFRERTTPAGKALGGIWLLLLPISVLTRGNFGGAAFAMVSSAMVAGWLWTLRSPRLAASAVMPPRMREGETVSVQVAIRAPAGKLRRGAGAWIFRTGDGLEAMGDGATASRSTGTTAWVSVPLRALKRGLQAVEGPSVLQDEPLGLFRSRALIRSPAQILVLPRDCRVTSMEGLLRGPGAGEFAQALDAGMGDEEFVGIRPWRDGDSLRSVHHRAWARTGKPAVRESEREAGSGVVLSFSSACDAWARRSMMEPSIVLAAALARFLAGRDALSAFFLDGVAVPLPTSDKALAVESALARLPGSGGWERARRVGAAREVFRADRPLLHLGFSGGFPAILPGGSAVRGLWVDWGNDELPSGFHRIRPEQILSGEVRI